MKIIDLLNKIANDEEIPKKIKFENDIYEYENKECGYVREENGIYYMFMNEIGNWYLNDEVEILEEEKKIPEKINNGYTKQSIVDMKEARFNSNDMAKICNTIGWLMENRNELSNKIDEIIDYLKSKGE